MSISLEKIVRSERVQGVPGMIAFGTPDTLSYVNVSPGAKQVSTLTVSAASDDKVYTVQIDGIDASYTSGTSATVTTVAAGLAAAINANGMINARVLASPAVGVITLTARYAGVGFAYAEDDTQLAFAVVVANAEAAQVPFGRAVYASGHDGVNKQAALLSGAGNVAQVNTLTLTYDAAVDAIVTINYINPATGLMESRTVQHTQATDAPASITALAAQINAVMPANTILAAGATNVLTLTAEVAGNAFSVSAGFGTGRDTGAWAFSQTDGLSAVDLIAGVTVRSMTQDAENEPNYEPNTSMSVLPDGYIFVHCEGEMTDLYKKKVYVRHTANGTLDKLGAFASAGGAGLALLKHAKWIGASRTPNVAILKIG